MTRERKENVIVLALFMAVLALLFYKIEPLSTCAINDKKYYPITDLVEVVRTAIETPNLILYHPEKVKIKVNLADIEIGPSFIEQLSCNHNAHVFVSEPNYLQSGSFGLAANKLELAANYPKRQQWIQFLKENQTNPAKRLKVNIEAFSPNNKRTL